MEDDTGVKSPILMTSGKDKNWPETIATIEFATRTISTGLPERVTRGSCSGDEWRSGSKDSRERSLQIEESACATPTSQEQSRRTNQRARMPALDDSGRGPRRVRKGLDSYKFRSPLQRKVAHNIRMQRGIVRGGIPRSSEGLVVVSCA